MLIWPRSSERSRFQERDEALEVEFATSKDWPYEVFGPYLSKKEVAAFPSVAIGHFDRMLQRLSMKSADIALNPMIDSLCLSLLVFLCHTYNAPAHIQPLYLGISKSHRTWFQSLTSMHKLQELLYTLVLDTYSIGPSRLRPCLVRGRA